MSYSVVRYFKQKFESAATGTNYLNLLQESVRKDWRTERVLFPTDGTPASYRYDVTAYLNSKILKQVV